MLSSRDGHRPGLERSIERAHHERAAGPGQSRTRCDEAVGLGHMLHDLQAAHEVEHAVIVQPRIGVQETTGFLIIWNGTREPVTLTAVESDAFGKISK